MKAMSGGSLDPICPLFLSLRGFSEKETQGVQGRRWPAAVPSTFRCLSWGWGREALALGCGAGVRECEHSGMTPRVWPALPAGAMNRGGEGQEEQAGLEDITAAGGLPCWSCY